MDRAEDEDGVEHGVEQTHSREEEPGSHRREHSHSVGVGATVHAGEERDHRSTKQGQGDRAQIEWGLDEVPGRLRQGVAELGEGLHRDPHEQPPADQVGDKGRGPEPKQVTQSSPSGEDGHDREKEVLGEELAVRQEQRHQSDAEGESGEQVVAGCVEDGEVRQNPDPDLHPAEHPCGQQGSPPSVKALAALLDRLPEGVDDLLLDLGRGRVEGVIVPVSHGGSSVADRATSGHERMRLDRRRPGIVRAGHVPSAMTPHTRSADPVRAQIRHPVVPGGESRAVSTAVPTATTAATAR